MRFLKQFDWFGIRRRRNERERLRKELALERALEREHALAMQEAMFTRMVEMQRVSAEGLVALAHAQSKQADVFSELIKSWAVPANAPTQYPPTDDEGQFIPATEGGLADFLPPGLREAYLVDHPSNPHGNGGFDREGSDFS